MNWCALSKKEIEINFAFFLEAKLINDIITDRR